MARFTLTIRNGPRVSREQFDSLDQAIEAMRQHGTEIAAEGGLPEVSMLRTFGPEDRVKARLELSTGGMFRRREAGMDLMGDGSIVAYRGGAVKHPLRPDGSGDHYDAVAEALGE